MVAADGNITKNFSVSEIANTKAIGTQLKFSPELIEFAGMIQEFRDWYNKPMKVNSWFRAPGFNKKCGGSSNSLHLLGLAMDWGIPGHSETQRKNVKTKWMEICKAHNKIGGINFYTNGYHLDCAEDKFGNKSFVTRDYRGKKGDW